MHGEYQGSVVIPAYNEEDVIGRCLEAIMNLTAEAAMPCPLEVAVVCNGCTDATAAVASKFANVTVIEIPEASKIAALNAGDSAVSTFPRIYLDADSEISNQDACSLLRKAAGHAGPAIFSASAKFDISGCSILAKGFSRCAQRTSFGDLGIVGRGLYALNAAGRARFGRFPELVGDDFFVASLFNRDEQIIDPDATVIIRPPGDLRSLIRVRGRIYYGNREAGQERSSNVSPRQGWRNIAYAARQTHSLGDLLDLAVYIGVNLRAKRAAAKMACLRLPPRWERDESSRMTKLTGARPQG
jgi:glycosyltransferase involved in cell wall biosynthesis